MENKKIDAPYEFALLGEDVRERRSFGRYEVVMAKGGAMYKNWTGYHIWVSRYAVLPDGRTAEKGLYQWLDALVSVARQVEATGKGQEVLDCMSVMTEANLSYPMTAFMDEERAVKFAIDYMKWLMAKYEELSKASEEVAPENYRDELLAAAAAMAGEDLADGV